MSDIPTGTLELPSERNSIEISMRQTTAARSLGILLLENEELLGDILSLEWTRDYNGGERTPVLRCRGALPHVRLDVLMPLAVPEESACNAPEEEVEPSAPDKAFIISCKAFSKKSKWRLANAGHWQLTVPTDRSKKALLEYDVTAEPKSVRRDLRETIENTSRFIRTVITDRLLADEE